MGVMKVELISNQKFFFDPKYGPKRVNFTGSLSLPPEKAKNEVGVVTRQKFESFRDVVESRTQKTRNIWKLSLYLEMYEAYLNGCRAPFMNVALEGPMLPKLQQIMFSKNPDKNLKLVFKFTLNYSSRRNLISYLMCKNGDASYKVEVQVVAKNLKTDPVKRGGNEESSRYSQRGLRLPRNVDWVPKTFAYFRYNHTFLWNLTVEVCVETDCIFSPVLATFEKLGKILHDRICCDFELISCEGVAVPCHKAVLAASSPVFLTKCQFLKEPEPNKMTMDLSEEGVHALLDFLYCGGIAKATGNSEICLELFLAGHEYSIPELEKIMKSILLQKPLEWFRLDTALQLFQFLQNYEGYSVQRLKEKVLLVVSMKSPEELAASEAYQEIFKTPLSQELFALFLQNK